MRGTVERYGRGWRYRMELTRDPGTGRRRFLSKGGFATEREARRELHKALVGRDEGTLVARSPHRLGEYLGEWLEGASTDLKPTTAAGYRRAVAHLTALLGQVKLQELTPLAVERCYARLLKGGLAPKTVRNTHTVLHRALADAERLGVLVRSPVAAARPPSVPRHERPTWSPEELSRFLQATAGHRLHAAFVLVATTGLRRGEVLGLRWSDVSLEGAALSVVQTITSVGGQTLVSSTKTGKSRRQVALDAGTVAVLRAHRVRQAEQRLAAGSVWQDHGLLFCREDGRALNPEHFTRLFRALVAKHGMRPIRLHDLRHTHATLALQAGVHPKVVSERLGHATVGITLDLYSHVVPSLDRQAAETIAALIQLPDVDCPAGGG